MLLLHDNIDITLNGNVKSKTGSYISEMEESTKVLR